MSLQLSSNVRQNYRIYHCVNKIEKCLTSLQEGEDEEKKVKMMMSAEF